MNTQIAISDIQHKIVNLSDRPPVMLARDLAAVYEVEPKQIAQAIRRNPDRFPQPEFCFRLSDEEQAEARSQNVTSVAPNGGWAPWAFTHMGANMLSAVLKTPVAAQRSVEIIRAFSVLEAHGQTGHPEEVDRLTAERDAALEQLSAVEVTNCDLAAQLAVKNDKLLSLQERYIERIEAADKPKPKRAAPKPLTAAEIHTIQTLKAQGLSHRQISERTGRSQSAISWVARGAQGGAA